MSVEVGQGEWLRHERQGYPEDMTILGLGPCTGVAVVGHKGLVAFGAHLTAPHSHEADVLREMLTAANVEMIDAHDVEITASGCCCRQTDEWQEIRTHVETQVREFFPKAVHMFRWPGAGAKSVNMVVDMESGFCDVEEI